MQRIFLIRIPATNRHGQMSPEDIVRTRELGELLAEVYGLPRDTILIGGPSGDTIRPRRWLMQGMLPQGGDVRVAENLGFDHVTQGHCSLDHDLYWKAQQRAKQSDTHEDDVIIRQLPEFIAKRGKMARACLTEYGQTEETNTLLFVSENASFIVPLLVAMTGEYQPKFSLPHLGVARFYYDNMGTQQISGGIKLGV